jgi:hypothetical protein
MRWCLQIDWSGFRPFRQYQSSGLQEFLTSHHATIRHGGHEPECVQPPMQIYGRTEGSCTKCIYKYCLCNATSYHIDMTMTLTFIESIGAYNLQCRI